MTAFLNKRIGFKQGFVSNSLKFLKTKKGKIIALVILLAAIGGWFLYTWRFNVLPQVAVNLLTEIPAPKSNEKILVVSPHPDDETIAAGGYIARAIKDGAQVWVVLVTDGNKHGLENQRYSEFKNATRILGVPEDHLIFMDYPDGALFKQDKNEIKQKLNDIFISINPNLLVAPSLDDYNKDHLVVASVVRSIAGDHKTVVYQYIVHHRYFPEPKKYLPDGYLLPPIKLLTPSHDWQTFYLNPDISDIKHEAVLQYRTQLKNPILHSLFFSLLRQNELFSVYKND